MRTIVAIALLLACPLTCIAEEWDYNLRDAMIEKVDETGNKRYSVDVQIIDYHINRISIHAKEYPPRFQSKEEQEEIIFKLNQLLRLLEIISENQQSNPAFLERAAFSYSMGHNVNLEGAAQKSKFYYEKLLEITPENPVANYQYGMFLSGTRKYHFDGIPY